MRGSIPRLGRKLLHMPRLLGISLVYVLRHLMTVAPTVSHDPFGISDMTIFPF